MIGPVHKMGSLWRALSRRVVQRMKSEARRLGVSKGVCYAGVHAMRVQMATHAVLWIGDFAKREQVLRKTARSAKINLHL